MRSTAPSTGLSSAPGADLGAYAEQLIARASTGSTQDVDLRAAVSLALKVRGNATRASQERAERIEAAVRDEGKNLTPRPYLAARDDMARRVRMVRESITFRLVDHELNAPPSVRVARRILTAMDAERRTVASRETSLEKRTMEPLQRR